DLTGQLYDGDASNDGFRWFQSFVAPGHRGQRIEDLVVAGGDQHTVQTMLDIQADVYSLYGEQVLQGVLESATIRNDDLSDDAKMVATALENWNYTRPTGLQSTDPAGAKSTDPTETSESIGCAAFQVLQVQLIAFTFDDELRAGGMSVRDMTSSMEASALSRIFSNSGDMVLGTALFDNVETGLIETQDDVVVLALEAAAVRLMEDFGPEMDDWRWG